MTAQTILHDLTARGVRLWAESGNLKLDAPSGILTDEDIITMRQHKADLLAAVAATPGRCPRCHDVADLQDRTRDVWWCAGCRRFFDSTGAPLPPVELSKPLTLEDVEPANLAADLLAAGCSFQDDDDGFHVCLPPKISASLLARWEAVDSAKLRHAAALLASKAAVKGQGIEEGTNATKMPSLSSPRRQTNQQSAAAR